MMSDVKAIDILLQYSEAQLVEIFSKYGEVKQTVKLWRNAIVQKRSKMPLHSTFEFNRMV